MAEPFIGEIRMIAYAFAPKDWAYCDGQLLAINQNQALYSLLVTTFGGDGISNFALPDLRGRVPVHPGWDHYHGVNLTQGAKAGVETVTLTMSEMPKHTHAFHATNSEGDKAKPKDDRTLAVPTEGGQPQLIYSAADNLVSLSTSTTSFSGGGQPHENCQPSLVVGFTIALDGYYPPRN